MGGAFHHMVIGDHIAVGGQHHTGTGGGSPGQSAEDGHRGRNTLFVDGLQGKSALLGHILHPFGGGPQLHRRISCIGSQIVSIRGANGGSGGLRRVPGMEGNRQGAVLVGAAPPVQKLQIDAAEGRQDTAQNDARHQHQGKKAPPVFGRPGGSGLKKVRIPGIQPAVFILIVILIFHKYNLFDRRFQINATGPQITASSRGSSRDPHPNTGRERILRLPPRLCSGSLRMTL